jgi:hypothetical protein
MIINHKAKKKNAMRTEIPFLISFLLFYTGSCLAAVPQPNPTLHASPVQASSADTIEADISEYAKDIMSRFNRKHKNSCDLIMLQNSHTGETRAILADHGSAHIRKEAIVDNYLAKFGMDAATFLITLYPRKDNQEIAIKQQLYDTFIFTLPENQ